MSEGCWKKTGWLQQVPHEEFCRGDDAMSRAMGAIRTRIKWPILQAGHGLSFCSSIVLSWSMTVVWVGVDAPSKTRQSASFFPRARLARKGGGERTATSCPRLSTESPERESAPNRSRLGLINTTRQV